MSDYGPAQCYSMLLPPLGMQGTHLPLVVVRNTRPIDVIEVLVLEGKKVVVPINRPPDAIVHGLVAMRMEVEDPEVKNATRLVLEPPKQGLVNEGGTIPPPPHAVGVEGVLDAEPWIVHDLSLPLPWAKLLLHHVPTLRQRRLRQMRQRSNLLMHRRQNPMVHHIGRDEEEPAPFLLPDHLRDRAVGDVCNIVVDLYVVRPRLICEPPDDIPSSALHVPRNDVRLRVPLLQCDEVTEIFDGPLDHREDHAIQNSTIDAQVPLQVGIQDVGITPPPVVHQAVDLDILQIVEGIVHDLTAGVQRIFGLDLAHHRYARDLAPLILAA
mmetsp:Transcript_129161/g.414032  ORF Transcript_129161/g.414032 Transcript_129161/m.414032 type:complete len:324 (+) Transcript_129161:184-1155(+)